MFFLCALWMKLFRPTFLHIFQHSVFLIEIKYHKIYICIMNKKLLLLEIISKEKNHLNVVSAQQFLLEKLIWLSTTEFIRVINYIT